VKLPAGAAVVVVVVGAQEPIINKLPGSFVIAPYDTSAQNVI
jgi:hypothetical protein